MSVFLGHSRDLIGNCIGFMNFLELCCQCKMWNGVFLASWYQVVTWPFRVHPWRLSVLHPWLWDRYLRENNVWTWMVHVNLVLKNFISRPLIIFYDTGLYWGKRFGHIWTHFVGYNCGFFTAFCFGGSVLFCKLSATLKNIWEICSIATIWESSML